ncbi:MAG: nitroreductase family protein [Thermoleophilia bacterium]|nr:nitroreductase family protein [Thermoleophilia bacterium]
MGPDELLTTTRAVRRRLDLDRDVPQALVDECLRIAQQAPTGGNRRIARFVVVRDAGLRRELGRLYREGWRRYLAEGVGSGPPRRVPGRDREALAMQRRVAASARHLADAIDRVPVHVIPCVTPRTDGADAVTQASVLGSVMPAVWSYMLAARARGLGTAWTTIHLFEERAVAELLGIPDDHMQVALIPTAFHTGARFSPAPRPPLDEFRSVDGW